MNHVRTTVRNLWYLTIGNGFARVGDHFQFLAVSSLTYAKTGSPLITALQMALPALAYTLWGSLAGRLADFRNPRAVVAVVNVAQALLTLAYLLVDEVAAYLALTFVMSTLTVFGNPARAALLPLIVGRENLLAANARQSTIRGAVELIGPALAGWALMQTSASLGFGINAVLRLAPVVSMALLRTVAERPSPAGAAKEGAFALAWQFLRSRPDLITLLLVHGAFQFGTWAINAAFLPYVVEVIGAGTDALGYAISAYFGASLVVGLVLERYGRWVRNSRWLFLGYLTCGVIWFGYSLVRRVWATTALSSADGVVYAMATTLFDTRIQEDAPPDAVGRIYAVVRAGESLCQVLGMLVAGWIATRWDVLTGMRAPAMLSLALMMMGLLLGAHWSRQRRAAEGML